MESGRVTKDTCLKLSRRKLLTLLAGLGLSPAMPTTASTPQTANSLSRTIPSSGERLPVIGMGTWLTFDIDGENHGLRTARIKVLETFFQLGGRLIDSSPMYGAAEDVVGYCLRQLDAPDSLFAATKVWTHGRERGIAQMEQSRRLWGVKRFDLMQIHNLLDWQSHMETLQEWKKSGRIRYLGITTSHGRRHTELENALRQYDYDFVQLTYNIRDREVEQRLLPLATEKGIAVIANRPFAGGELFSHVSNISLPSWAREIGCENWAQFFLKFIIGHAAICCAIPATSQVPHMVQNMGAAYGTVPDAAQRRRMAQFFLSL